MAPWVIATCIIITNYRRQISDSSKLKEFADDNFKFDKNGSKLSKRVENTVGKGEIACYEQFLLFPQCFQKARFPGASKGVIVWEWDKDMITRENIVWISTLSGNKTLVFLSKLWKTKNYTTLT